MKGKISSILSVFALALALAMAPLSAVFADDSDELEVDSFDVLDDSDSEDGSILELDDSEDSESEDFDSEDSDGDLDDSDSEDDSEEDEEESLEDDS